MIRFIALVAVITSLIGLAYTGNQRLRKIGEGRVACMKQFTAGPRLCFLQDSDTGYKFHCEVTYTPEQVEKCK